MDKGVFSHGGWGFFNPRVGPRFGVRPRNCSGWQHLVEDRLVGTVVDSCGAWRRRRGIAWDGARVGRRGRRRGGGGGGEGGAAMVATDPAPSFLGLTVK